MLCLSTSPRSWPPQDTAQPASARRVSKYEAHAASWTACAWRMPWAVVGLYTELSAHVYIGDCKASVPLSVLLDGFNSSALSRYPQHL